MKSAARFLCILAFAVFASNALAQTNPAPTLTSLAPNTVNAGNPGGTIAVTGSNFVAGSAVTFNGTALSVTFVNATRLNAQIPAALLATAGAFPVIVTNPAPGGGSSAARTFTVNALPAISAITPPNVIVGAAATTITVDGTAFAADARVRANGADLTTTFVSATRLTAVLPASMLSAAALISVRAFNPGIGSSADRVFNVNNPLPVLASLSPASVSAGSPTFTLSLNGSGFMSASRVWLATTQVTPVFVSATVLQITIDASLAATVRTIPLRVDNPVPGGGSSAVVSLSVIAGTPCPGGCNDNNPCTTDTCGATACVYTPVADGPYAGTQPTSCGLGACAATGRTECRSGAVLDTCTPGQAAATDDSCDGVDQDCNGTSDEDYVAEAVSCGVGACASTGNTFCAAGVIDDTCTPGQPAALDDSCDEVDQDCDGVNDEDYLADTVHCGIGACAANGSTFCAAGLVGETCTPGQPAALDSSCDGVDQDCDGVDDEDYLPETVSCGTDPCIGHAQASCVGGQAIAACTPPTAGTQCDLLADLRPGRPKPWEDVLMWNDGGAMAVAPNGNLQNRIALCAWQPPGVGPPIQLALKHNSAASTVQLGFGLGFRLGATLSVAPDGTVTLEDEDGTPRVFTPSPSGDEFISEVFDRATLVADGTNFVLRAGGGFERIFQNPHGLGWVETMRRDRVGDTVTFEYDAQNRLTRVRDSVGRTATFTLSDGFYSALTDPEGRTTDLRYENGRLVRVEQPAVSGGRPTIFMTYAGASGRMSSRTTAGQAATTTFNYDTRGRLAAFTLQPFGHTTRIDYTDGQVAITDSSRRTTIQKFAGGQVIASISPTGLVTRYGRDNSTRPVLLIDHYGRREIFAYNDRDDLIAHRDEAGRLTTHTFDDRHNLLTSTDPYGDTATFTYNQFDQILTSANALNETTQYIYDAVGNLRQMIDFAGVTRMNATYNQFGQPLTLSGPEGLTTEHTYDARGNLATLSIPGLPTIQRTSTLMNQTLTHTNAWGETRSFAYDALGRVSQFPYGPGSASVALDLEGRITATEVNANGRVDTSAVTYTGHSPTSMVVNGVTLGASPPTFTAPPIPPAAECAPTCGLRCGASLGDTCGGLIDCACDSSLSCNDAGYCVE